MGGASRPAKICAPRLAEVYPTAFKALDRARRRSIVWISAPAGAGKTTLVGSYVRARRLQALWYRIDAGDADAAGFFHHLRLAAGRRARLPPPAPPGAALDAWSGRFFDALFARFSRGSVLVLDNYQNLPRGSLLEPLLIEAFASLPEGANAIVISRGEPPPAWALSLANGELEVVGWEHLRLSLDEAMGLARHHLRQPLSRDALRRLHHVADGWAAGLVLLLERGAAQSDAPVPGGAATQRVFDYFATEVLARTDAQTRLFLLRSVWPPMLSESMAQRLSGLPGADRNLARLYRQNFFIEKAGTAQPVYRYHPLFQAFLRERAAASLPADEVARIQRDAGRQLLETGHAEEAFELLVCAADWKGAAEVILGEAQSLVGQGRLHTLQSWIAALPPPVRHDDPWLTLWDATCRLVYLNDFVGSTRQAIATGVCKAVVTTSCETNADCGTSGPCLTNTMKFPAELSVEGQGNYWDRTCSDSDGFRGADEPDVQGRRDTSAPNVNDSHPYGVSVAGGVDDTTLTCH